MCRLGKSNLQGSPDRTLRCRAEGASPSTQLNANYGTQAERPQSISTALLPEIMGQSCCHGQCVWLRSARHIVYLFYGMHRFDPLSLAADEKALTWFQQAELVHCRTAMAAVAGIVIPGVCSQPILRFFAGCTAH